MKKIFQNIKAYKTTILGLILLCIAGYVYTTTVDHNVYLTGGLFVSGIVLILSPDTYIKLIEKVLDKWTKD